MDIGDLEALALALYDELGLDPSRPPTTYTIARKWLGPGAVRMVANLCVPADTYTLGGRQWIAVRASLPLPYAHHAVGHELGHCALRRCGYVGDDEEACADYIGAALMMPRPTVHALHNEAGFAPDELAQRTGCTQTAAALRFAEVLSLPLAVVTPSTVRTRAPEPWIWPEERTLRAWAQRPRPGISRVRLTDQPRRVALLADDDVA